MEKLPRQMWKIFWPDVPEDEIPIGHVTNGVHFQILDFSGDEPVIRPVFRSPLTVKTQEKKKSGKKQKAFPGKNSGGPMNGEENVWWRLYE